MHRYFYDGEHLIRRDTYATNAAAQAQGLPDVTRMVPISVAVGYFDWDGTVDMHVSDRLEEK